MATQQQQKQKQLCTAHGNCSASTPASAPSSKPKVESIIPLFDLLQGDDPYAMPSKLNIALKAYFVAAAEKVEQSDAEVCSCCGGDVEGRLPLLLPAFYRSLQAELLQGVAVLDRAAECCEDVQGRYRLAVVAVLAGITKAAHNDDVAKQLLHYHGQHELGNAARIAAHAGCARIIAKQRVAEQLGTPLEQCCNEHLPQLLPVFRDTLKQVQTSFGSSTTDDVAATTDQAMIWSTAVALLQAPGVTAAASAAEPAAQPAAQPVASAAAAPTDAVPASKALIVPAEAATAGSSNGSGSGGGWGAFSSLAGLFRGVTSRKVRSAATASDAAAGQHCNSGSSAQRSSIYASAAAAAASGGTAAGGALVLATACASDDAEPTEDPFEQEVKLKFWSPACADYTVTMTATTAELDCIERLSLHIDCNEEGWNALHYAAATHKVDLVQQLLEVGANPCESEGTFGLQPLHLACMGRVKNAAGLEELMDSCNDIYSLQRYAMLAGPACRPLVQLLLSKQADPTSAVDCFFDELAGLTPLHLLACWHHTLSVAPTAGFSATWVRAAAAQHIGAVRDVLQARSSDGSSADVEARTVSCKETPLTFAAFSGSWAVVELLLQAGANPNLPRLADAVRPLDLAVALKHSRLACLLLERGAEVLPSEAQQAWAAMAPHPAPDCRQPNMLLLNAVDCGDPPHNGRLVELLLQRGVSLEEVNEKGETALLSAVMFDNAEMVRLLVAAGANIETPRQKGLPTTPLAEAAADGQMEILQILLDAGADHTSHRDQHTGYDIVQLAANGGQFAAVVKLVEAGASWRLAPGKERVVKGNCFYVPEILSIKLPGLKVGTIEARLHAAEKVAKQRKGKVAADEARNKRTSSAPVSNGPAVVGGAAAAAAAAAQEQPSPAAGAGGVDDIDALAAEIEALGDSSRSSNLATAASGGSKKSKKQEKLKKQRAREQQKQQQRSTQQGSGEASEDEEDDPAARSAAAADHLSELLGDVSLEALQRIAGASSSAAAKQQQLPIRQQRDASQRLQQQQQQQPSQRRQQRESEQQELAQQRQGSAAVRESPADVLAHASALLQQVSSREQQQLRQQKKEARLQQRAVAYAAKSRPPPGVAVTSLAAAAQQAAMQQAAEQQSAAAAAAAAPAAPARSTAAAPAAVLQAAATGAAGRVARAQVATANTGPNSSSAGRSSGSGLPAAGVSPASTQQAAAATPTMLESWRGSLNPILMWGRSSSSGNAAAAAAAMPAGDAEVQQQAAGQRIYNPQQFQQQQSASPAVPSAMMAALQGSMQQAQQQSGAHANCPAAGTADSDGASKVQTQQKCIVCMEQLRDVLLLPCKHLVLCGGCAEQLEGRGALDSCPYCRQTVVKRVRVHQ